MNGSYFQNPTFPGAGNEVPEMNNYTGNIQPIPGQDAGPITMEQSYIENILRLNKGKKAKAYFSFADSLSWRDKIFEGYVEQAGRDHLVMSGLDGRWFLIPMIYLDYVEFEEQIAYRPNEVIPFKN